MGVHRDARIFIAAAECMVPGQKAGLGHLDTSAVCKAIETAAGIDREMVE